MNIEIKLLTSTAKTPEYKTEGSAGFDFYSSEDVIIKPGETKLVRTGVVMNIPKNYGLFLFSRSSMSLKKDALLKNGVGVIDSDYSGDNDEILFMIKNISSDNDVEVKIEDKNLIKEIEKEFNETSFEIFKERQNIFVKGILYYKKKDKKDDSWYRVNQGEDIVIKEGDRIGQGVILETPQVNFSLSTETFTSNRGGFGSTGK